MDKEDILRALFLSGERVYCLNCGANLPEGAKFCAECGRETAGRPETIRAPVRNTKERLRWPFAVIIIGAVIIALLVIVVLLRASESDGGELPWEQDRSGTLELTLFNDDWTVSRSYSVYVDGGLETTGALDPLSTSHLTIDVSWKGDSTHLCNIEVYSEGTRHTATSWLTDEMSASVAITI